MVAVVTRRGNVFKVVKYPVSHKTTPTPSLITNDRVHSLEIEFHQTVFVYRVS